MNTKVSIVIPCYNCEVDITRAIKSVINQTYKNWELILIDNNSTDNTKKVLLSYQKKFHNNIFVYDEYKKGAPAARNKGLLMSDGDWIQFLDADDELMPNKIYKQLELLYSCDADIIVGRFNRMFYLKNRRVSLLKPIKYSVWEGLISGKLGITSSNLWKRSALLDVKGWDENLASSQEYDLMFRLLKDNKKVIIDKGDPLTNVYFGSNSITRSLDKNKNLENLNEFVNLRNRIKEHLIYEGLYNKKLQRQYSITLYSYILDKKKFIDADFEIIQSNNDILISCFEKFKIGFRHRFKRAIRRS